MDCKVSEIRTFMFSYLESDYELEYVSFNDQYFYTSLKLEFDLLIML